jgi:hypothetical protein
MLLRWWWMVVVVLASTGLSACYTCKVYCPHLLTIEFVDGAGNPLTPDSVALTEPRPDVPGFNDPRVCGSKLASCEGNRLTLDVGADTRAIRAKAATGETFEGTVSPTWAESPLPSGACLCPGTVATVQLTLTT